MIEFGGAVFLVVGFIILMKFFSLVEKSLEVVNISKYSVEIVRDKSLNDHQKEIAMQKYAKELFFLFFLITLGGIAAVLIPFGVICLLESVGVLTVDSVIETTLSLEFIIATLVITIGYFWLMRGKNSGTFRK